MTDKITPLPSRIKSESARGPSQTPLPLPPLTRNDHRLRPRTTIRHNHPRHDAHDRRPPSPPVHLSPFLHNFSAAVMVEVRYNKVHRVGFLSACPPSLYITILSIIEFFVPPTLTLLFVWNVFFFLLFIFIVFLCCSSLFLLLALFFLSIYFLIIANECI